MFIDKVTITLSAGKGGNGIVAWRREKFIPKGGPSGGNGGNGGSVIFKADDQLFSLDAFRNRRILNAENGLPGGGNLQQGRGGRSLILKVPCGTLVKDAQTKEVLFDFTEKGQELLICNGGRGGKGNNCFKSPTNQAPNVCTMGTPGVSREIELELKLIADVGFIGIPNAGKSTLLAQMSKIFVKTGAYPFTTLHPNLSYIQFDDFSRVFIADIPGIIQNAHENKGLGLAFLRHVERTSVLLYVVDASGFEERDPIEDFETLKNELKAYRADLMDKPFVIALNKMDIDGADTHIERFREAYTLPDDTIFGISALTGDGLTNLIEAMRAKAQASGKRY
ncbi:MAG: GTPase ObgE [Chlamydiota bacterium]